ncbi:hypothetical protein KC19_12G003700 [Ceratodon purpureus]|uniref:Sugar phosphate transporter domain-containing protein n=1 Tax=Ceratodon purpureus TaxID=3225 RepID=A0A8T0G254_CERPU|nr:hypothetical protein KC19_12G003700 [Ceratodon purpureus]
MMNSLTLSKMRDSTINTICLSCHVTSSTTQFQCMTINMRTASTKTTFFKPILTLTNLDLIPSLSKNSFRLTILSKKEALIKKAPMWQKIVADASNGPTSPDPKFQSKEKSNLKVDDDTMVKAKLPERLKIGIYFAIWWSLNVVFNIYNKKVLNVALSHTIGHVAATISMSKVAVSFTHIIKSSEPAFTVIIQRLVFGQHFTLPVYLSLLPIMCGCGLAAATELNFNMTGFMGAMISNIAFVFRNIFSKKGMSKGKTVGGINYYGCLSIMSLVFLIPFAIAFEGPRAWCTGWKAAELKCGNQILRWVVAQSVFYHFYNQVSYMSLNEISPLTFSIGNTMKRVIIIASSILIFQTKVLPINVAGAAIAIFGTFLYSQVDQ